MERASSCESRATFTQAPDQFARSRSNRRALRGGSGSSKRARRWPRPRPPPLGAATQPLCSLRRHRRGRRATRLRREPTPRPLTVAERVQAVAPHHRRRPRRRRHRQAPQARWCPACRTDPQQPRHPRRRAPRIALRCPLAAGDCWQAVATPWTKGKYSEPISQPEVNTMVPSWVLCVAAGSKASWTRTAKVGGISVTACAMPSHWTSWLSSVVWGVPPITVQ